VKALLKLPGPPPMKGRDGHARWMSTVAFLLGMACLVGHQTGLI
jgi:hypothetical protein